MTKLELEKKLLSKEFKSFLKKELKKDNIEDKFGILTGAYLTQLVRKFLNKPLAHNINDIDIFILEKSKEEDLKRTINGDNKSVLLKHYNSFYELEKDNVYYIICSERHGLINKTYIKKPKSNYLNNSFPKQIIESFDINSVRIAYDLKSEQIYFCKHFINYLQSNQLEIINFKSPISSMIRLIDKHYNNEGFYDLEEAAISSYLIIMKNGKKSEIPLSENLQKKIEKEEIRKVLSDFIVFDFNFTIASWNFGKELSNKYPDISLIPMSLVNRVTSYWIGKIILRKVKEHVSQKFLRTNENGDLNEVFNFYLLKSFSISKKANLEDESTINSIILLDDWLKLSSHHYFMEKIFYYTTSLKNILKIYVMVTQHPEKERLFGLVENGKIKIIDLYDKKTLQEKMEKYKIEIDIPLNHPDIKGNGFLLAHLNSLAKCQSESELMQNCMSGLGISLKDNKKNYHYFYHLRLGATDFSLKLEIRPFSLTVRIIEIKKKMNDTVEPEQVMYIRRLINRNLGYKMFLRHVLNAISNPSLFFKLK